ncbi:MAG: HAD-IC family P-type ATPase, partial [Pontibacter sp.]|nr:HAD-IC family P-type ATPase [Pontibacter sp.]
AVILDKTGTITEGKPVVTDIAWSDQIENKEKFQQILLAMEAQSEHPLAEAVVTRMMETGVTAHPINKFESITGKGVTATLPDQSVYYVGNLKLIQEHNILVDAKLASAATALQNSAKTVVYFTDSYRALAVLAIADKIKATSKQAIQTLQQRGIEVYMLTGDNEKTAAAVALEVGLKHFKAEVLPSEKADFVKSLQQKGKVVAMVGDGINDSHALAQADVSIAMGKGSDIAMDVAKMTLITSDLQSIPKALQLSKKTVLGIRQNLFWAFIYNIIGIPIAAGILYPVNGFLLDPMIAGAAMALSSVSVVSNSLRLKMSDI